MTVFDRPLEAIAGDLESLAATFLDFIKIASCFGSLIESSLQPGAVFEPTIVHHQSRSKKLSS